MKQTINRSCEDYLETIYNLSQDNAHVRSTDVANALRVTKPSTHRAIASLTNKGLVNKEAYGTIMLTEQGRKLAQNVLKKHEAVRKLLIDVLNVSPQNAEADACKIEHCISEETTQKLYDFLAKCTDKS